MPEEDRHHIGHQRDRVLTTDTRISSCNAARVDDGWALVTGCRKRGCPRHVPNPGRKWLPIIRNNASGPKLPPLRCTVPGSRIRDRRTGTAQNGYLGQKREQSADQRGTIQKPHLKLVTTKSAALQVRWATTL